jgi:cysteinyl-tRNA synthetase
LETRQQQLEAELYSRDYRESPEFKAKYQAKADKIFQTVQTELKGIQVTENDVQRPATLADFGKIRSFGDSQVEQRRQAKALFGEDADVVLSLARELKGIEDVANDEIEAKRNGFQSERQQQQQRFQSELQTGQRVFGEYDKLLVEKFPQYFAPIEGNDEFNQALQQGVQFVDSNSTGFNQKSPEQRAQSSALIRRWASAWPANQILIKQNTAKIAELEATVLKLQGSDPGAGGESGGGMQAGGEEVGGTDAMSAEIEKLQQQV